MTTFALIHGAWGSAEHLRAFADELRSRGHEAVAVDLPIDDVDARFGDYAAVVDAALGGTTDDVVVVAKSMGGCTAPLIAARRPVRSLVFVGALLPQPGRTLADLFAAEPMILPGATDGVEAGEDKLRRWTDEREARAHLWHDADDATAAWAFRALRPQSVTPYFEPFPLDAYPDCERTYVVCRDDRTVSPDWGREAAPRILGVDVVEIDGGHSPGIVRPAELADLLGA